MDPGSFAKRRTMLDWRSDVRFGLLLVLIGTWGAWWVASTPWRPLLLMFLPMSLGMMTVFLGSGVLHELAITLPVRSGFGLPTLDFALHGLLTLLERRLGRPMGRIPAWLAVILPLGLLFPPAFQQEVIARFLEVFR